MKTFSAWAAIGAFLVLGGCGAGSAGQPAEGGEDAVVVVPTDVVDVVDDASAVPIDAVVPDPGPTGTDVVTGEVDAADAATELPAGCCDVADDCGIGQRCVPGEPLGRCVADGVGCFGDGDCGPDHVCAGAIQGECGGDDPVAGTCEDAVPVECCTNTGTCSVGSCWAGYCVGASWAPGACTSDLDCGSFGELCVGGAAESGICESGGSPPSVGACTFVGEGGLCPAYSPGIFGDCAESLGWMWAGNQCVPVSGCGCQGLCDALYPTREGCEAACSPPTCCAVDADCPGGRCHLGHCATAPDEGHCFDDGDCDPARTCAGESSCPCGVKCGPGKTVDGAWPPPGCSASSCDVPTTVVYPGECVLPPTCCGEAGNEALTCASGEVCVLAGVLSHRCAPVPPSGACWTAADCGTGEQCVGPVVCDCHDLECLPSPGECKPYPDGCCAADAECAEGTICTAKVPSANAPAEVGAEIGQCVAPPSAGACYRDGDCAADEWCPWFRGYACGLDAAQGGPIEASCLPRDGTCCGSDFACADGFLCRFTSAQTGPVCKPVPDAGRCWDARDCAAGEACLGAETCGLCAVCSGAGVPGTCEPIATGCCTTDAGCAEGQWCSAAPQKPFGPPGMDAGQCVARPPAGACFRSEHCAAGEVCADFFGLPCGAITTHPTEGFPLWYPGQCTPADGACCDTDADCGDGFACLGSQFNGVCKPLAEDGACWQDVDCGAGLVCVGASVCGCYCEEGTSNVPGACAPPP